MLAKSSNDYIYLTDKYIVEYQSWGRYK